VGSVSERRGSYREVAMTWVKVWVEIWSTVFATA
jgi:hypothetical protein